MRIERLASRHSALEKSAQDPNLCHGGCRHGTRNALIRRSNLFDDFFSDFGPSYFVRPLHGDPLPSPASIKVDVKESDDFYTVHAEVPGVSKDDIQVELDGSTVTLRAEVRQQDTTSKDEKVLRSERYYGAVSRSCAFTGALE